MAIRVLDDGSVLVGRLDYLEPAPVETTQKPQNEEKEIKKSAEPKKTAGRPKKKN